ncbi:MAG: DUF1015 family protein [Pseudomonadota bacterium]|nr:DUF1015 family protein [Pseudomonadota bacterium]
MPYSHHTAEPLIRPFKAYRPATGLAEQIVAVPYDVITRKKARKVKKANPLSFLSISRADADFPDQVSQYDQSIYDNAALSFNNFIRNRYLISDSKDSFYVYRISNSTHAQTGIAFSASVQAYTQNRIKKHELTRPEKELDRVKQINATKAITSPVLLVHPNDRPLETMLENLTLEAPVTQARIEDWHHEIWQIADRKNIEAITARFSKMRSLYIADGHHRSAAAQRVAHHSSTWNRPSHSDSGFLAVSFPQNQLVILDYNRVIRSKRDFQEKHLHEHLKSHFELSELDSPFSPTEKNTFGMYHKGKWFCLRLRHFETRSVIESLDVSLLQNLVLEPFFGISDPRTDDRIDFVGGPKSVLEISRKVDEGEADVGFTLAPTTIEDLISVADENLVMPPKSTWFEPKLADGLLCMPLE